MVKKKKIKDPFAKREAQKYSKPVPSRELILEVLAASAGPMKHMELADYFALPDYDRQEALRRRLIAMERDGQLISNRKGAYGPLSKMDLVKGRVQGHKDGYGFLLASDSAQDDIFLTHRQMRKVFDGDEVLVRPGPTDYKGRTEGVIVEVLARNTQTLVGRFYCDGDVQFVRPDNARIDRDIHISKDNSKEAKHGQIVVMEIVRQPSKDKPPLGRVAEVLGDHLAPGMEIDVAIRSHSIPSEWPEEVTDAANKFAFEVESKDKKHRVDLTQLPLVTIDGEDAKDFDDAVYCEKKKSGAWRLIVAIADVSHYVPVDSPIDREAQLRGTSVYFPGRVVPMLPEILSNGLCSLNPDIDRLAIVCEMSVSAVGKVSRYKFYEALIHSHARLTYTKVADILERRSGKAGEVEKSKQAPFAEILGKSADRVLPMLQELHLLYAKLREQREVRGAIDFETRETRIVFDEDRKIKEIVPTERNDAHKLIEECMLAANVCAAKFLESHEIPGLFRVHEGPKQEKLELLKQFLKDVGINISTSKTITPQDYQNILQATSQRSDANIIQTVLLRSMNQAVYQSDNVGHFGLAFPSYAHFTSPIRRYPDLLVHRAIRRVIRSKIETTKVQRVPGARIIAAQKIYPYSERSMLEFGEHCSSTERRADEATRDVTNWLKCEFLSDKVGESFMGSIAAVTGFGIFVELDEYYVEGLVHVTSLPQDYYHFDASKHCLIGERTHQKFKLGDRVKVKVSHVNLDERKIDFELEVKPSSKKKTKGSAEADPKKKPKKSGSESTKRKVRKRKRSS